MSLVLREMSEKESKNNIIKLFGMNEIGRRKLSRHTKIDYDTQIINQFGLDSSLNKMIMIAIKSHCDAKTIGEVIARSKKLIIQF